MYKIFSLKNCFNSFFNIFFQKINHYVHQNVRYGHTSLHVLGFKRTRHFAMLRSNSSDPFRKKNSALSRLRGKRRNCFQFFLMVFQDFLCFGWCCQFNNAHETFFCDVRSSDESATHPSDVAPTRLGNLELAS